MTKEVLIETLWNVNDERDYSSEQIQVLIEINQETGRIIIVWRMRRQAYTGGYHCPVGLINIDELWRKRKALEII